jgi:hypothetical protein
MRTGLRLVAIVLGLVLTLGCGESSGPEDDSSFAFDPSSVTPLFVDLIVLPPSDLVVTAIDCSVRADGMEPVSGTLDASVLSAAAARSYESGAFDLSASPGLPAIELPFEIPGLPRGEGYVVAKATSWRRLRRRFRGLRFVGRDRL